MNDLHNQTSINEEDLNKSSVVGMGKMPSAEPTASPVPPKKSTVFYESSSTTTDNNNSNNNSTTNNKNNNKSSTNDNTVELTPTKARAKASSSNNSCHNCKVTHSPLWRKDNEGKTLCNKCGLYLSRHGQQRPLDMDRAQRKTPVLKKMTPKQPKKTPKAKSDSSESSKKKKTNNGSKKTSRPLDQSSWSRPNKRAKHAADDEEDPRSPMNLDASDSAFVAGVSPYSEDDGAADLDDTTVNPDDSIATAEEDEYDSGSDGDYEDDHPVDFTWFEYNHPYYNKQQPPYALYHMEQNVNMPLSHLPVPSKPNGITEPIVVDRSVERDTTMCLRMEQLLLRQQELIYHQQMELLKLQAMSKNRSLHRLPSASFPHPYHNRNQHDRAIADESRVPSRAVTPQLATPQQQQQQQIESSATTVIGATL